MFMGGTDQMDANIKAYRIRVKVNKKVRGKKWWWLIFTWLIDAAIQNSWIIYKIHNPETTQLEFRREIAKIYLKNFKIYQNHLVGQVGSPEILGYLQILALIVKVIWCNTFPITNEDDALDKITKAALCILSAVNVK